MSFVFLIASLVILVITKIILSLKYVSLKNKYLSQKEEMKMYKSLLEEAQRKVREEANKNIILQSLINQKLIK